MGNQDLFCTDLYDKLFPDPQIDRIPHYGKYVGDDLDKESLKKIIDLIKPPGQGKKIFYRGYLSAMMIVAQTGKGKNRMIQSSLLQLAKDEDARILYLCNRTALSQQQRHELSSPWEDIDSKPFLNEDYICGMTYQYYYKECKNNSFTWNFKYVVLDEAHFFFSDTMFNPDTWNILKSIPQNFSDSVRIYMTATPDEVIEPIYSAELIARQAQIDSLNSINTWWTSWLIADTCKVTEEKVNRAHFPSENDLPKLQIHYWPYDFSAYRDIFVFTRPKLETKSSENKEGKKKTEKDTGLLATIRRDHTKKWVIFVDSKDFGKKLLSLLSNTSGNKTSGEISALYIDRDSKYSSDESYKYDRLIRNGNLGEYDVLITTPVLDNGFSIHDKDVGHVVLFSDERTEFLQELGRIRLEEGQCIKVYFAKMDRTHFINEAKYNSIMSVLHYSYGSKDLWEFENDTYTTVKKNLVTAAKTLYGDSHIDSYHGIIGFHDSVDEKSGEGSFIPYVNHLARWYARVIKREMDRYNQEIEKEVDGLDPEDKKKAEEKVRVLYKLRWLFPDPKDADGFYDFVIDIDKPTSVQMVERIDHDLSEWLGKPMKVPEKKLKKWTKATWVLDPRTPEEFTLRDFVLVIDTLYKDFVPDHTGVPRQADSRKLLEKRLIDIMGVYTPHSKYTYQIVEEDDSADTFHLSKVPRCSSDDSNESTGTEPEDSSC